MNALIQEGLLATKHVAQAAIVRREGLQTKAKSAGFEVFFFFFLSPCR